MDRKMNRTGGAAPRAAFRALRSALCRFRRDERGQGILFAAASLIILVGFVVLVANIGRVVERRVRVQLAADSAVYSGAMVEANSLSAIGWINSAMGQVYYNAMKYSVDVNVTAVAAELERRVNGGPGPAWNAWTAAMARARENMPLAKEYMRDLSRLEHAIAILTPRLVQEEMFAVATQATGERISTFPSFRLFPFTGSSISYRIEHFANGWRITNLTGGTNESVYVYLTGRVWHIEYSNDGIVRQTVLVEQEADDRWHVRYFNDSGALVQEVVLVRTQNLGWVIYGTTPGGRQIPQLQFDPVDMDGDGVTEGTRITDATGFSQVFRRGGDGNLYVWRSDLNSYYNMTSSQTVIAGVTVQVNVTNRIEFPGGSADVGDPTIVHIGNTTLTLTNPPQISTGLGPVSIGIRGFDPDSFTVSVGGFSLSRNDGSGRWVKRYDPIGEIWWRNRLTPQAPEAAGALSQWQYDYQTIGAHLRYDNPTRYLAHVFGDRLGAGADRPEWTDWFDPNPSIAAPFKRTIGASFLFTPMTRPDGSRYDRIDTGDFNAIRDDPQAYYLTTYRCPRCDGLGGTGLWNAAQRRYVTWTVCATCDGRDWGAPDGGPPDARTDIRVFLGDIVNSDYLGYGAGVTPDQKYLDAPVHNRAAYNVPALRLPLVLAEEFFQYGINTGVWKSGDKPILFPDSRRPAWGYVALSCARVGIADANSPDPTGFRYQFDTLADREDWCTNSAQNLYSANIRARLYPARDQVRDFDLDLDILQGTSLNPVTESGVSYLWHALLGTSYNHPFETSTWLDRYEGRSDPRVAQAIRNMRNRRGATFDSGSDKIAQALQH
jgi:hypothetical protein